VSHISLQSKHYGYLWIALALAALFATGEAVVFLAAIITDTSQGKPAPFQYVCSLIGVLIATVVLVRSALYYLKKYQGR
jgi:high-affinity Fe2+/Pb2+ permease